MCNRAKPSVLPTVNGGANAAKKKKKKPKKKKPVSKKSGSNIENEYDDDNDEDDEDEVEVDEDILENLENIHIKSSIDNNQMSNLYLYFIFT